MADLTQITNQPDRESKPTPQELAKLFADLKNGTALSVDQHDMLEKALNVAAKREPAMMAQVAFQQEVYSGPLPHYDQLNGYDDDTRRAIVDMAVREQQHDHTMRFTGLTGAIQKDRRGQYCALSVAVAGLATAGWISQFSPTAAAIIGGLDLVALVGIFLVPRLAESRSEKQTEKKSAAPAPEKKRTRSGRK